MLGDDYKDSMGSGMEAASTLTQALGESRKLFNDISEDTCYFRQLLL